ncbi:MAG TPA: serine/threonine-protein kinase [Kofleriaceae bacterium]|jgi:serine/threonine-protein kinase|nr:serine/threonine-protein kinase [Kofleriaceae bacterium]
MLADPGRTLGKYRLVAEIARGGMGIVYLAMVHGPGGFHKLVVIKELKPELVEDPAFLTMFLDEARLAARLNHPNIVQTNEVGNDGHRYFMAMDYLDGRGLDRVRRRSLKIGWGLTLPMHLRVICDMLSGLDYAHNQSDFDGTPLGIVHRDVSPQNVFLTFEGQVKLLDFGIAKAADSTNETNAGILKGKVSYMAPEQARGLKVDARADVFSAGVMLWEALTGRKLHQGSNEQEMLWALASADLPRASTIKPWVAPELDEICAHAMAWNRDKRFPTAAAFRDELEGYLSKTDTAVSSRDVAGCITELFRDERATMTAVIEAHVARARGLATAKDELPVIELTIPPLGAMTPSGEERRSTGPFTAPHLDSRNSVHVSAAPSTTRPVARSSKARLVVPLVGALAIAGAVAYVATRPGSEAPPPAPAAAIAKTEPLPPSPPPPTITTPAKNLVDVDIRVTPSTATVTIDGATVASTPFHAKYAADTATHEVRASAPGYVSKVEAITLDASVRLDLSLERVITPVPSPAPVRAAATPTHAVVRAPTPVRVTTTRDADPPRPVEPVQPPEPKPVKPEPTDVNPNGGNKPRRPIESNNPYGERE